MVAALGIFLFALNIAWMSYDWDSPIPGWHWPVFVSGIWLLALAIGEVAVIRQRAWLAVPLVPFVVFAPSILSALGAFQVRW
jgi:hypothetical protein